MNKILHKNILEIAEDGRGDGTIYAWGTTAVPSPSAKTFVLTTVNIIDDIGADADNKFKGYVLEFDSSENKYLITSWTAAGDIAATLSTPSAVDTGDWTIRRALFTQDFAVASPILNAVNGKLYRKWADGSVNNAADIMIALPNGLDDGSFESGGLTHWTTTGNVFNNSSLPILGTYDCRLVHEGTISQPGKIDLEPGKTYGMKFKSKWGNPELADYMHLWLEYTAGEEQYIPITFSLINLGDTLVDLGNGTDNGWDPLTPDSHEWQEATFTVPEYLGVGDWTFFLHWDRLDSVEVWVDQIAVWEIVSPDTLIIAEHNMAGGFPASSLIRGYAVNPDSSEIQGIDYSTLLDLNAVQVDGGAPVYETFTESTSIWPIFVITITALAGKTWEAGEIWLGKMWEWANPADIVATPETVKVYVNKGKSRRLAPINSQLRATEEQKGKVVKITPAEALNWGDFLLGSGYGKPFWFIIPADTILEIAEAPVFMQCKNPPVVKLDRQRPGYYEATFDFEETGEGRS